MSHSRGHGFNNKYLFYMDLALILWLFTLRAIKEKSAVCYRYHDGAFTNHILLIDSFLIQLVFLFGIDTQRQPSPDYE